MKVSTPPYQVDSRIVIQRRWRWVCLGLGIFLWFIAYLAVAPAAIFGLFFFYVLLLLMAGPEPYVEWCDPKRNSDEPPFWMPFF